MVGLMLGRRCFLCGLLGGLCSRLWMLYEGTPPGFIRVKSSALSRVLPGPGWVGSQRPGFLGGYFCSFSSLGWVVSVSLDRCWIGKHLMYLFEGVFVGSSQFAPDAS